jgi:hypothetical protein
VQGIEFAVSLSSQMMCANQGGWDWLNECGGHRKKSQCIVAAHEVRVAVQLSDENPAGNPIDNAVYGSVQHSGESRGFGSDACLRLIIRSPIQDAGVYINSFVHRFVLKLL